MHLFESALLSVAGNILFARSQSAMKNSNRAFEKRAEFGEFLRIQLVKRCCVAAKRDDKPPHQFARIRMFDLPMLSDIDGRPW